MQVSMNTNHDDALDHLITRLSRVAYDHKDNIYKHYNIRENYPDDEKEAKEWFDKGNFSLDYMALRWGPKADHEGANVAVDKMYAHKTKAEDIIRVKTDEDARLKALNDFESATFH